jgi:peptide/nickel transport system substrate-binding protein
MKKICLLSFLAAFSLTLTHTPCQAERDTLVVSMGTQPLTPLNPAYTTSRQIIVLYHNWGDTLLYRDPVQKKIVPCLAESYCQIDPRTIEFKLRKGVRFHNGEPFDAQAVRFSMNLLKGADSLVSRYLAGFDGVEVVDHHTIRIKTSFPHPTALEVITNILYIYPPDYYREVGKEGFDSHPIGTGPYQFVSSAGSSEVCFKANPEYFGGPKGQARIPRLKAINMAEELLQIESLISGQADLVRSTNFYQEQVPFVRQNNCLKIKTTDILRLCFLTMDAMGRSGTAFFKDKRVRMAVNHAINREKIIQHAYRGYASRADSVTSPLHFGHEPDVMRYPYDPARARRLLTEAGYPDGFAVDLFASINESACESIVRDLLSVGIKTRLHWMGGRWNQFYQKFLRGEMPLAFLTWGSYSIFDAAAILNPFFIQDVPGCYGTTPEVSAMLTEANQTIDQEKRQEIFSKAQKMIADEAFWAPLCTTQAISMMNSALNFQPSHDEIDRYFTASWD